MEEAIIAAAMQLIEMAVAQIREAKMATEERKAAILARLNSSTAALTSAEAESDAELDALKKEGTS